MKAQFLKIAKVKDEKAFYKKYPTEAAFFKAHPKAKASIKKAQIGSYIGGERTPSPKPISYQDMYDETDKEITGSTASERLDMASKQAAITAAQAAITAATKPSSSEGSDEGGDFDIGGIASMFGGKGGGSAGGGSGGGGFDFGSLASMFGGGSGRNGKYIPRAQVGINTTGYTFGQQSPWGLSSLPSGVSSGQPATGALANTQISASQAANQPVVSNATVNPSNSGGSSLMNSVGKYLGPAAGLIKGFEAIDKQRDAMHSAQQAEKITSLGLKAEKSKSKAAINERKYVRPEDNITQAGQMFPTYGVGTNVLARNGYRLQDGGEIQNTYSPEYDLYDDLEYEPLNDSDVKQYYHGGGIPRAQGGFSSVMNAGGTDALSGMVGQGFDNNAGYQIGSSVGNIVKMIPGVGSVVGAVAAPVLGAIGGVIDNVWGDGHATANAAAKAQRNMGAISNIRTATGIQAANSNVMKDGGYMNPEYNPQVITMFGDHTAEDFADYAHKYRAGGHLKSYTPPSERAMETYAMGGQLKTHWGGKAETMSYNPYMPGSGETVLFKGQSHTESDKEGNTGIGITYGESPVEVERGEPMFEMQSGGEVDPQTGETENTGVVFGNMQVDKKIAGQLDDPDLMEIANKYHGKKFKTIGIELAKQEVKQNKIIDKNTKVLDSFKVETSLDKAKLAGIRANMEGADTKLRNIANTKITLANYQNAINDAKDELSDAIGQNLSAEDLAKGYTKLDKDPVTMDAKWGGNIVKKAQNGETTPKKTRKFKTIRQANAAGYYEDENGNLVRRKKKFSTDKEETKSADALDNVPAGQKQNASGLWGKVTQEAFDAAKNANPWFDWNGFDPKDKKDVLAYQRAFNARAKANNSKAHIQEDGDFGDQTVTARINESKKSTPVVDEEELTATLDEPGGTPMEEEKTKFPWGALANTILPFLRPSDVAGLDMAQLYPEMFALTSNQLEPVPAQGYRPDLGTPYDISFQDQLNANQADYNASQKMVGYNPAALATLNAQKYAANTGVLGSQFRANQEMKDKVYGDNRNILNQSKVTNLDIFDRQYGRQAEARSNTKATTQAALNSISDKYAKNKLENRKLSIYENMYNYRFGKSGRAQSYNPLQFFDYSTGGAKSRKDEGDIEGLEATRWDKNGNPIAWKKASDKSDKDIEDDMEAVGGIGEKQKNGGYTKIKSKNGSILRDFKNL
jgi:hypothetical protein